MEKLSGLSHLFVTVFLSTFANFTVIPAITDVTMLAVCPGRDECSLAIYLTGSQQAVRTGSSFFFFFFFFFSCFSFFPTIFFLKLCNTFFFFFLG
jgi:hypothetical protein